MSVERQNLEDLCNDEKSYPLAIEGEIYCGKDLMDKNKCRYQLEPEGKHPFYKCLNLIYLEIEHCMEA